MDTSGHGNERILELFISYCVHVGRIRTYGRGSCQTGHDFVWSCGRGVELLCGLGEVFRYVEACFGDGLVEVWWDMLVVATGKM